MARIQDRVVDNPLYRLRKRHGFSGADVARASLGAFSREQFLSWSLAEPNSTYAYPSDDKAVALATALRSLLGPEALGIPTATDWDRERARRKRARTRRRAAL